MSWRQFRLPVPSRHQYHIIHTMAPSVYLLALAFPHFSTLCSCSSVQASKSTDFTRLMCVPIPRCMPEHLYQVST